MEAVATKIRIITSLLHINGGRPSGNGKGLGKFGFLWPGNSPASCAGLARGFQGGGSPGFREELLVAVGGARRKRES